MRTILLVLGSLALSTAALAENVSCQSAATAQKLTGNARLAFLKKCEAESKARLSLAQPERRMSEAPTSEFGHCMQDPKDL